MSARAKTLAARASLRAEMRATLLRRARTLAAFAAKNPTAQARLRKRAGRLRLRARELA